jgi:hypothetical protein
MHHAGPGMHPAASEDMSSDGKVHHFSPAMHQTRAQRPAATPPEDAAGPRDPAAGPKWCKAGGKWCIKGAAARSGGPAVHPAGSAGCISPSAAPPPGAGPGIPSARSLVSGRRMVQSGGRMVHFSYSPSISSGGSSGSSRKSLSWSFLRKAARSSEHQRGIRQAHRQRQYDCRIPATTRSRRQERQVENHQQEVRPAGRSPGGALRKRRQHPSRFFVDPARSEAQARAHLSHSTRLAPVPRGSAPRASPARAAPRCCPTRTATLRSGRALPPSPRGRCRRRHRPGSRSRRRG